MNTLDSDLRDMQKRLSNRLIQRAYRGVVSYMSRLQTVFADQRGERAVRGLYQGYFDMTYFALTSDELKGRDLKLAVVFNYETFGFEVWLAGRNRKVQRHYWERFLDAGYAKHRLVESAVGIDAIVMAVLPRFTTPSDHHVQERRKGRGSCALVVRKGYRTQGVGSRSKPSKTRD